MIFKCNIWLKKKKLFIVEQTHIIVEEKKCNVWEKHPKMSFRDQITLKKH